MNLAHFHATCKHLEVEDCTDLRTGIHITRQVFELGVQRGGGREDWIGIHTLDPQLIPSVAEA